MNSLQQVERKVKPQEKREEERNQKIVNLYESSKGRYSYASLGRIFKITSKRIGQIIKRAEEKEKNGTSRLR